MRSNSRRSAEPEDLEQLRETVEGLVDDAYEAKEAELGNVDVDGESTPVMRAVERWVMLRTIDTHWIEHLTAMEELREGIYLRGYGQQDPLVAYKREAHDYFEQMQARVAAGVAQTVLRVSVKTAEQAEQDEQKQGQAPQQTSTSGNGTTSTGAQRYADEPRPADADDEHGKEARAKRSVLVRIREEIQEVSREMMATRRGSCPGSEEPAGASLSRNGPAPLARGPVT